MVKQNNENASRTFIKLRHLILNPKNELKDTSTLKDDIYLSKTSLPLSPFNVAVAGILGRGDLC